MISEEKIALECPYCRTEIYQPLGHFKKDYFTCPGCESGLVAGQFRTAVEEIEHALDWSIEERLCETEQGGCCGRESSGCCGGHSSCG